MNASGEPGRLEVGDTADRRSALRWGALVVLAWALASDAFGEAAVWVSAGSWGANVVTGRSITITPVSLWSVDGTMPAYDTQTLVTDTNGGFWISNMVSGTYQGTLQGPPSTTVHFFYVDPTNSVQGAGSNMVASARATWPPDQVAWSAAASDARYAFRGTIGLIQSVGITVPGGLGVTGSPLTASGTFGITATNVQGFWWNDGSGHTKFSTDGSLLTGLTNAFGSAAYSSASAFDAAGAGTAAANAATNVLGSAAYSASSAFDAAGAGTAAANAATNVLGSAAWKAVSFFDAAGAAQGATNGLGSAAWLAAALVTQKGNVFNLANDLLQLDGNALVPVANMPALATVYPQAISNLQSSPVTLGSGFTISNANNGTVFFVDLASNAYGLQQTNGYGLFWTNGILCEAGSTNTMWVRNLTALTNVSAGVFNPIGFTTATLPATATNGATAYASDCITPQGSGSRVWYDGTNWRLNTYNIKVTTDTPAFVLNSVEAAGIWQSRRGNFTLDMEQVNGAPNWLMYGGVGQSGTGAGQGLQLFDSIWGSALGLQTGTTTTGDNVSYGPNLQPMASGIYYGCGGIYYVSAAATTTDNYWTAIGLNAALTANYPTEGVFFLYDQCTNNSSFSSYIAGLSGAAKTATNDWVAVCAHSSSYTFQDTGLPVSTSHAAPNRLGIIYTNGAALFFTNGVLANTITANQMTAPPYLSWNTIFKTAGTTSRYLGRYMPWQAVIHPTRTAP